MNDVEYWKIYRENGQKIAKIKFQAATFAQTHHNLTDIDAFITQQIKQAGGEPAFMRVPGYKWASCISLNSQIVHGIPKGHCQPGDIITIDTGMYYQGTTTDTATSFVIGQATAEQEHFLSLGKKTLHKAIKQARAGKKIKDISKTIQTNIEAAGYNVTRNLTGHGVGETMHEEPPIPCFISNDPALKTKIEIGMVLAIEVMYMKGDWPMIQAKDGWTLSTKDGSESAVFEEDVLVTPSGPEVLTSSSKFTS